MLVHVEFFGVPRRRAGVSQTTVELQEDAARLGEVLKDLAARFPDLATACLAGDKLRHGFAANLSGRRFVSDPGTRLHPGDSLLIFHADAGG